MHYLVRVEIKFLNEIIFIIVNKPTRNYIIYIIRKMYNVHDKHYDYLPFHFNDEFEYDIKYANEDFDRVYQMFLCVQILLNGSDKNKRCIRYYTDYNMKLSAYDYNTLEHSPNVTFIKKDNRYTKKNRSKK